ncbi:hypothetical protein JAAARDRAFT_197916 [Jaapia argillacea MUCL 33604]|uniref:Uncharacterized protein n=1 Tax=Jaapia argillacea MUCL 33604 TaxID=933084 RepID=A0A067PRA6_9AGAM|nr:hypothetical protein JAAARDRAFT_197916 [Jaapia argillacea MUCL 33604]
MAVLPPLTQLSLANLSMAEVDCLHVNSDTNITFNASYHPDSLTYSIHKSDYQLVSPFLSTLGDSYFESTTACTKEQTSPPSYKEHPSTSPADAPNPHLPMCPIHLHLQYLYPKLGYQCRHPICDPPHQLPSGDKAGPKK